MRIARAARYSLLALLSLLVVGIVLLLTVDLGRFRDSVENLVSEALQRDFSIDGEFHVKLGRRIYIVAEDVAVANVEWGSNESLATIGRLESTIDAWSIMGSPIRIESLDIRRVRVNLERDADGNDNWTLFPPEEETEPETPGLPVLLVDASITDFALAYDSPERQRPFAFTAAETRAARTDADALEVTLDGLINDTPIEMTASASTIDNLIGFSDVQFKLSGNLGEISFDGEASVDDLAEPRRPTARFELRGPNVEYLTGILNTREVTTGPLNLTASVAPLNDRMQLGVNGLIGEFSVDVTGYFVDLQHLEDVQLRVAASGPDASTVARLAGNDTVPADPFNIVGTLTRSGRMVAAEDVRINVGESQFVVGGRFENFPDPRSANAIVEIRGPDFGRFNRLLGLPGKLEGPFTLDASVTPEADGGASINLQAVAQDVRFTVDGDVSNKPDFLNTRVVATFAGPNVKTITTALGLEDAPEDPFELSLVAERVTAGAAIETGTLTIGDNRLSVDGLVGNQPLEADTDIRFEVAGPDLAKTLTAFGLDADELPEAQYRANGRIERGAEYFIVHDVMASIGSDSAYAMSIDGRVSTQPAFEGTRLRISATGASLGALTDAAGIEGMPDVPFAVGASVERRATGISVDNGSIEVGNDRIDLSGLIGEKPLEADTDLHIEARAPDLKASLQSFGIDIDALPAGAFRMAGDIRHRGTYFDVQKTTASLAGANATVNGRLGEFPDLKGTALTVQVDGTDLARLLPDNEKFSALNKPYGLSANVTIRDETVVVDKLAAFVDQTRLGGDVAMSLAPTLGSGRLSLTATSPDLFRLAPRLSEKLVVQQAPLEFRARGSWQDKSLKLDELFLQLARGTLTASGALGGPPGFEQTDLNLDLNIASIRSFSMLAGRELPDDPAEMTLRLVGGGNALAMNDFRGTFGDSDITGSFSLATGDVHRFNVDLRSNRLNLAPYLPEAPDTPVEEADAESATPANDRVIPDTPIPTEALGEYLGSVDVRVGEINLRRRSLSDIVLVGALEDGALQVRNFNVRSSREEALTGALSVLPVESGAEVTIRLEGSKLRFGLQSASPEEFLNLPQYDLDTVLHGHGSTVRELAGSLDGYARVIIGKGRIRTTALAFFTNDFLFEVLDTVNPLAKSDPYTNFECGAVLLKIDDGKVVGEPALVAQSEGLRIFANANVDLKTEKLNAVINTVPRKGLGLSFSDLINPFVKLDGTLAKPTLNVDPEGVIITGGAAVATGGISILAKRFKDRFLAAQDPCAKAVEDTAAEFATIKARYLPGEPETL